MQVYQRQLLKADLASATIEAGGGGARGLSQAELKQLFRLQVRGRDGRPAGRAGLGGRRSKLARPAGALARLLLIAMVRTVPGPMRHTLCASCRLILGWQRLQHARGRWCCSGHRHRVAGAWVTRRHGRTRPRSGVQHGAGDRREQGEPASGGGG